MPVGTLSSDVYIPTPALLIMFNSTSVYCSTFSSLVKLLPVRLPLSTWNFYVKFDLEFTGGAVTARPYPDKAPVRPTVVGFQR